MPWEYWSFWLYYGFPVGLVLLYFFVRRKQIRRVGTFLILGAPLAFGAEFWTGVLRGLLIFPLWPDAEWAELVDTSFRYGVGILLTVVLLEVVLRLGVNSGPISSTDVQRAR
jgi:hypothetical protein